MIFTALVIGHCHASRQVSSGYLRHVLGSTVNVIEAGGGPEGLALLATRFVDVVLLDLSMPGMSGLDVLAEMQRRNLPPFIVVLSEDLQDRTRERVTTLGAAAVVEQPLQLDALRAALRTLGN
ncbi:MAG: response regulator [Pseudomonadota bacterium]